MSGQLEEEAVEAKRAADAAELLWQQEQERKRAQAEESRRAEEVAYQLSRIESARQTAATHVKIERSLSTENLSALLELHRKSPKLAESQSTKG